MSREQARLEPQALEQINEVLGPHFTSQQRNQFNDLSIRWSDYFSYSRDLENEANGLLTLARKDVEHGQTQLAQVEQNFQATHEFIYHPRFPFTRGRLEALWGRVLVGLHIRTEHPWLATISAEKNAVSAFLEQAQSNLEKAPARIEKEFTPQIKSAEGRRAREEEALFRFCEKVAVQTGDNGLAYARIVPFRSYDLSDTYAQTYYLNPQRVPNLEDFTDQMAGYIRQRARRDRTFRVLLKDPTDEKTQILTPLAIVSATLLPTPLKNRLRAWTSYHFLMGLYRAGIIAEPDLPEILREL